MSLICLPLICPLICLDMSYDMDDTVLSVHDGNGNIIAASDDDGYTRSDGQKFGSFR